MAECVCLCTASGFKTHKPIKAGKLQILLGKNENDRWHFAFGDCSVRPSGHVRPGEAGELRKVLGLVDFRPNSTSDRLQPFILGVEWLAFLDAVAVIRIGSVCPLCHREDGDPQCSLVKWTSNDPFRNLGIRSYLPVPLRYSSNGLYFSARTAANTT